MLATHPPIALATKAVTTVSATNGTTLLATSCRMPATVHPTRPLAARMRGQEETPTRAKANTRRRRLPARHHKKREATHSSNEAAPTTTHPPAMKVMNPSDIPEPRMMLLAPWFI
ncbi:hypothetical protein [Streptomyces albidoflavus]|uniref:hypothetical protein n=1 Tax=Streptomyces albidoflavus TaxID=1886 RepID=UPI0033EA4F6D